MKALHLQPIYLFGLLALTAILTFFLSARFHASKAQAQVNEAEAVSHRSARFGQGDSSVTSPTTAPGDSPLSGVKLSPAPTESMDHPEVRLQNLNELTPAQTAVAFYQLVRQSPEDAARFLESSSEELLFEKDRLSAILLEEVIRTRGVEDFADWMIRLAGSGNDKQDRLHAFLDGSLGTEGLIQDPNSFLQTLSHSPDPELAEIAQTSILLRELEQRDLGTVLQRGSTFGIQLKLDDPHFDTLMGEAMRKQPQKVLLWLRSGQAPRRVTDYYLPLAEGLWAWHGEELSETDQ